MNDELTQIQCKLLKKDKIRPPSSTIETQTRAAYIPIVCN